MKTLEEKIDYYNYLNSYLRWLKTKREDLSPCQAIDCTKYAAVTKFEPVRTALEKLILDIKTEMQRLNKEG